MYQLTNVSGEDETSDRQTYDPEGETFIKLIWTWVECVGSKLSRDPWQNGYINFICIEYRPNIT